MSIAKNFSAALLPLALLASAAAWSQQGPGYGIARTVAAPPSQPVSQPLVLIRSHPVYLGSTYRRTSVSTGSASGSRGPYMVGSGQWVPAGAQADALLLMTEPGDTMATPAAASGHWDWRRATMADLVEMSRRNKASRGTN